MSVDGTEGIPPSGSRSDFTRGPTTEKAGDVLMNAHDLLGQYLDSSGKLREGVHPEAARTALAQLEEMRADMRHIGSHPSQLREMTSLIGQLRYTLPPDTARSAYAQSEPGLKGIVKGRVR